MSMPSGIPEVFIGVQKKKPGYQDLNLLLRELTALGEKTEKTLIFVKSRKNATEMLLHFRGNLPDAGSIGRNSNGSVKGYTVEMYSKSTHPNSKARILKEFGDPDGPIRVLIATVAFGMGVNVGKLYSILIFDLPESYNIVAQMLGRASRDHLQGNAMILYPGGENSIAKALQEGCVRKTIYSRFVGYTSEESSGREPCSMCLCCTFCSDSCNDCAKE